MQFDRRIPTYLQMLALIGAIGISGYLTYTKATNGIPPCTVGGGCAAALYSPWGYIAGIPLAYIGLTASIVLLLTSPWRLMSTFGGEMSRWTMCSSPPSVSCRWWAYWSPLQTSTATWHAMGSGNA